jgi:hypothetical protein
MERILFSEIPAFEAIKQRNQDLERQITQDINYTLTFVNYTAPAVIASAYSLAIEGAELWRSRHHVDYLFATPFIANMCSNLFISTFGLGKSASFKKQYVEPLLFFGSTTQQPSIVLPSPTTAAICTNTTLVGERKKSASS